MYKNDLIKTNIHACVGCDKCIRICPVDSANVAFLDRQGRRKVRTDSTKCLGCGACVSVCHRRARYYSDDTYRFFRDLGEGKRISLLISPSFSTNFPDYKNVIHYLREMGVNKIYDVSMGVDIYVWAHLRYVEKVRPLTMITTFCPVLTSYCELYRPELLPRLSPIRSPCSILAIYLKEYLNNNDDLAILSPCLSKNMEFDPDKENLKYALTFSSISDYIRKNLDRRQTPAESDFDQYTETIGTAVSVHDGFHRIIEYFADNDIRVDQYSGQKVFRLLDIYASTDPVDVPQLLDLVSCEMGCSLGPAHVLDLNNFKINKVAFKNRNLLYSPEIKSRYQKLHKLFDKDLKLDSFYQLYTPTTMVQGYVSEQLIERAFESLGKRTVAEKTIDCFSCGATTCRDMAVRIALGVNIPQNCVNLARETAVATNKRFTDYLQLIRVMGEYMLGSGRRDKFDSIENSLMALCSALNATRASVWKTSYDSNELPRCDIVIAFPGMRHSLLGTMTHQNLPDWLDTMGDGNLVIKSAISMTPKEKKFFVEPGYDNLCCIPIMADGDYWGFLMIVRGPQKPFTQEEISVVESASFLIISNLMSSMPDYPYYGDGFCGLA